MKFQSNLIPIISVSSNNLCKYGILFHIYIKWYEEILKRWYLNPQKQFRSFVSPDHDSREKRPCIPLFQIAWVSMWKPSGHGFPSWKPVILYLCSLHGSGMSTKDWSNHPGCFFTIQAWPVTCWVFTTKTAIFPITWEVACLNHSLFLNCTNSYLIIR